jgi:hypothetical protein
MSAFGPAGLLSQRVNQVLRVPNLDGDARRIHEDLSWFRQKKALRPAGRGEYCISLHLSACVGVTSCERGNCAQVSKEKCEYKGGWFFVVCGLWFVCLCFTCAVASCLSLACFVEPRPALL